MGFGAVGRHIGCILRGNGSSRVENPGFPIKVSLPIFLWGPIQGGPCVTPYTSSLVVAELLPSGFAKGVVAASLTLNLPTFNWRSPGPGVFTIFSFIFIYFSDFCRF